MTAPAPENRRQRRVLIGLAVLFFAPLGLAFYLYYGHAAWLPGGRVNAGALIEPPRPLPALVLPLLESGDTDPNFLKGKWTLLFAGFGPCAELCRARLYDTRQIRLALDRDMKRVQRVLIADTDCCDARLLRNEHPDLIMIRASPAIAPLLTLLPMDAAGAAQLPRVYLIDPLGNLMMFYGADVKPKGILEDLKRLLRLSSIG
jgi:cytochrome oxidase Cu insertion factor (SCO1/SenC/PrrC family)